MRKPALVCSLLLFALSLSLAMPDTTMADSEPAPPSPAPSALEPATPLSNVGVGVQLSTLGPGAEAAVRVSRAMDIRGGVNYFSYNQNFTSNGINYSGNLKFASGQLELDYYLWRSLHVSPGLLLSNGNLFGGAIAVPGGQDFSINSHDYASDAADPLTGRGALKFNNVAPSILFGIGSLVPRGRHHISVKLEVGGAFRGSPNVGLNFTGSVCTTSGVPLCQSAAANTAFQSDVAAQEQKYNNDLSFLKFYPILSLGIGFKL